MNIPQGSGSQADRMLTLLKDGQWHSIGELFTAAGVGRPNSRAADLRARGHHIEYRHDPRYELPSQAHQYRLVTGCVETPTFGGDLLPGGGVSTEPASAVPTPNPAADAEAPTTVDGQLVLVGGAFTREAQ